jgi:hypothetical protein
MENLELIDAQAEARKWLEKYDEAMSRIEELRGALWKILNLDPDEMGLASWIADEALEKDK